MIIVKSHTRKTKNGVSVVRSHKRSLVNRILWGSMGKPKGSLFGPGVLAEKRLREKKAKEQEAESPQAKPKSKLYQSGAESEEAWKKRTGQTPQANKTGTQKPVKRNPQSGAESEEAWRKRTGQAPKPSSQIATPKPSVKKGPGLLSRVASSFKSGVSSGLKSLRKKVSGGAVGTASQGSTSTSGLVVDRPAITTPRVRIQAAPKVKPMKPSPMTKGGKNKIVKIKPKKK